METYTVVKRYCSRLVKYGIIISIALLCIYLSRRKGNISVFHRYFNFSVSPFSNLHIPGKKDYECILYTMRNTSDAKYVENGNISRGHNDEILNLARRINCYYKTVLVSVVNDAYLPFAYSWLCNTKNMEIHKSVLVITTDMESKIKLNRDWPDVSVFHMKLDIPKGNQEYSHVGYVKIMIRRTELIFTLLLGDIDLLLLEFDYVWFSNPIPDLQRRSSVDMLVNPVSNTKSVFNGGLLYLFATDQTKALWAKLTDMMWKLERDIKAEPDKKAISEGQNDQIYLSKLVHERYANITTQLLTLDKYADGKWYSMTDAQRRKLRPFVISNNWIIGNENKIKRAKKWNHWFLRPDNTCDMDMVKKIVYKE